MPPSLACSLSSFTLLLHALLTELLHLWQVVETSPAFTHLDVVELGINLDLGVARSLHGLPEALELFERDLAVLVDVNLVKKLARRNFSECTLPVLNSLVLVDGLATINIEDAEHFVYLSHSCR